MFEDAYTTYEILIEISWDSIEFHSFSTKSYDLCVQSTTQLTTYRILEVFGQKLRIQSQVKQKYRTNQESTFTPLR